MSKQGKKETDSAILSQAESVASPALTDPKESPAPEAAKVSAITEMVHLIVFKLGAEDYAIKIDQIKEVTVTPSITRMPRTPGFVKGVANIRGDIIAIMNLEERFGIRQVPEQEGAGSGVTYTLVIEAKEYSIGVIVREMPQSLNLAVSKIDKTPAFLQDINVHENYIEGIAKVDNRLIIVLDMYRILTSDEISQLSV